MLGLCKNVIHECMVWIWRFSRGGGGEEGGGVEIIIIITWFCTGVGGICIPCHLVGSPEQSHSRPAACGRGPRMKLLRAPNEMTRATNIPNALQNHVIVILVQSMYVPILRSIGTKLTKLENRQKSCFI